MSNRATRLQCAFPALALMLLAMPALAAGERPALIGVSSIRIANYGSPSVLLEGRDKVGPIIGELNALRRKPWQSGDTKLACYSTLVVMSGKKILGTFRIRPEHIIEREGAKGVPIYSLAIDAGEIPRIGKLLTEIPPAKDCD
jgi:hypothetical protein